MKKFKARIIVWYYENIYSFIKKGSVESERLKILAGILTFENASESFKNYWYYIGVLKDIERKTNTKVGEKLTQLVKKVNS